MCNPRLLADRELALFKMRASHGADRTEILELTKIFHGKVVDVGTDMLTIAMSGDPGKLYAFEKAMRRFDLVELARTGRIALRKSDDKLDLGTIGWSPTAARELADVNRGVLSLLSPSYQYLLVNETYVQPINCAIRMLCGSKHTVQSVCHFGIRTLWRCPFASVA